MKLINYLLFGRMKVLVEKSNKKIKKLEFKLKVEKIYNERITKDALDLIEKIERTE